MPRLGVRALATRPVLKMSNVPGTCRVDLSRLTSCPGNAHTEKGAITAQWGSVGFCLGKSGLKEQKT